MITVDATVVGPRLSITCAGEFGVGSDGSPSGNLVKAAIKEFMERDDSLREVVIDFTRVDYVWGDGPAWSVLPWAMQGIEVTYVASKKNEQALRGLFTAAGLLERSIEVTVADES